MLCVFARLGAIEYCYRYTEGNFKKRKLAERLSGSPSDYVAIVNWNDSAMHKEVVSVLKELDI